MEQIKDFRLTSTPKILIIGCALLLLSRVGLSILEFIHPAERARSVAWTDALKYAPAANDEKKLRLYEFYADWCSPCQRLERDVMSNSEIRDTIEQNFVALRVIDRQREDGKNDKAVAQLQKKYRVFAFPTLVVAGPDGEAIGLLVGNSSSLAVYRFLSRVLNDQRSIVKRTHTAWDGLRKVKRSIIH